MPYWKDNLLCHNLDVKHKGKYIPIISGSALTSEMKNHLFVYLVFEKEAKPPNLQCHVPKLNKYKFIMMSRLFL